MCRWMEESPKDLLEVVVLSGWWDYGIYIELKKGKLFFAFFPRKYSNVYHLTCFYSTASTAQLVVCSPLLRYQEPSLMDTEM